MLQPPKGVLGGGEGPVLVLRGDGATPWGQSVQISIFSACSGRGALHLQPSISIFAGRHLFLKLCKTCFFFLCLFFLHGAETLHLHCTEPAALKETHRAVLAPSSLARLLQQSQHLAPCRQLAAAYSLSTLCLEGGCIISFFSPHCILFFPSGFPSAALGPTLQPSAGRGGVGYAPTPFPAAAQPCSRAAPGAWRWGGLISKVGSGKQPY